MCRRVTQVLAITLLTLWVGLVPATAAQAPATNAGWNSLMPGPEPWTPAAAPPPPMQGPPTAVAPPALAQLPPPAPSISAPPPQNWATEPAIAPSPSPQPWTAPPAASPADGTTFQASQWLSPPRRPRSDWYARVDYFSWREYLDNVRLLEESGPLVSLGYLREGVYSRIRVELFGGSMNYDGATMDDVPLTADTGYFGGRFELDAPLRFQGPRGFIELFAGVGTRLWNRDLSGGVDAIGRSVTSYYEDWWTVYAYLGLGTSRALSPTLELYGSTRFGATVYTQQHMSLWDVNLQPRPGFHGAMEFGLRGEHLAVALRMETTAWGESAVVPVDDGYEAFGALQPESLMTTIGLSLAYTY